MDANRIFSAEQIIVPPALPGILKEWTKEVIRVNPQDMLQFSADYFQERATIARKNCISESELQRIKTMFEKYDTTGSGEISTSDVNAFVKDDLEHAISDSDLEKVVNSLDADGSGVLEFDTIVEWWSGQL